MLRLLLFIFIAVFTTASLSYIERTDPEALRDILVRIDIFGVTPSASEEKARIAQIRALTIPYEQKRILMERTVFLGATRQMVYLALGDPQNASKESVDNTIREKWLYYFNNEQRGTALVFEDDLLVHASKE